MKKKLQLLNIFFLSDQRLNRVPMLASVRKGLTYMIPLLLLGSFALLILSLPVPAYQGFMSDIFGKDWGGAFLYVRDATFNILSIFMVICISYSYINELGEDYNISPIIASCVSLGSFIAISGISGSGFSLSSFGTTGIFVAIVVSTTSSYLFVKLSSISMLKMKAYTNGVTPSFRYALTSIFPAAITVSLFAAINHLLISVFHIANIHTFISNSFSNIFYHIESPFLCGILFIFLVHVFWLFGMHGSNILEPVTQAIYSGGAATNHYLLQTGRSPDIIFTKTFFDSFVLMGGCGAAFCLVIAILFVGKYTNQKGLAKMSLLPLLFNINELIVFGLPIVLNPIFVIPFIGVPILITITSFLAMFYGLVPYTTQTVEWTTPILLSGYISTQSFSGSLLQLFNIALGVICYIPFVRLSESASEEQMKANLQKVYAAYQKNEERGYPPAMLSRHDEVGNISRFLAADLVKDLKENQIQLHYQPQTDYAGNAFGVEALLRWNHSIYGYIYPPLVIALAEESHIINDLGNWIFAKACSDLKQLQESGHQQITMAINISAAQLESDDFIPVLKEIIKSNRISSDSIKIEITEQIALAGSKKIIDHMNGIKEMGIKLAMDDFGMGHSSLKYLKEYEFDTIKLDGCLVREVASNANCRNIISSIVFLGKSMNCSIIAEYVEEEAQKNALYEMGCERYQGYLYSKPLPYEELLSYLDK